ncbi:MAG: tRNA-dependent cyclodipeptide synthase [Oscillatoria sp. SIO1A7]|nr:tRNA-dependent cyclodipeptide synthase [Oscillatoria sp. SIO1A7]
MNSSYKVKSEFHHPLWREKPLAMVGISLKNDGTSGTKFSAMLEWASRRYEQVGIILADTLYKHTFMSYGIDEKTAYDKALNLGDRWLEEHQDILQMYEIPHNLINRWDDWICHPEYKEIHERVLSFYQKNKHFQAAVKRDASNFLNRSPLMLDRISDDNLVLENACNFLLEEVSADINFARHHQAADIYPGKPLETMEFMRNADIPDALKGLDNFPYVSVRFRRRRDIAVLKSM